MKFVYDPLVKYCGPSGTCEWCKRIRRWTPRALFGVDFNEICFEHDVSWIDGPDLSDDTRFARAIYRTYSNHNKHIRGALVAAAGFLVVRLTSLFK